MYYRVADLGCGSKKIPGTIGVDISVDSNADVVCDLNKLPCPFRDSVSVEVVLDNVPQRFRNAMRVTEDLHQCPKIGAAVRIFVPYFRSCMHLLIQRTCQLSLWTHSASLMKATNSVDNVKLIV